MSPIHFHPKLCNINEKPLIHKTRNMYNAQLVLASFRYCCSRSFTSCYINPILLNKLLLGSKQTQFINVAINNELHEHVMDDCIE
jgi:hypothetical protein